MKTIIVLHHSADSSKESQYERIRESHLARFGRDYPQYHYIIEPDATVRKTGEETDILYHSGNFNERAIGICIAGHLGIRPPTQDQIRVMVDVIDDIKTRHNVTVLNHRDVRPTACPIVDLAGIYHKEEDKRLMMHTPISIAYRIKAITRGIRRAKDRGLVNAQRILEGTLERLKMRS